MKRVFTISSCLALTTGLALSASSVLAQDLPAPPPDARGVDQPIPVATATNPAVDHLQKRFGISQADAIERLEVQHLVTSQLSGDPGKPYDDVWLEHEPQFKVIVTFTDKADRTAFVQSLDPKLRKYVQTRVVSKTRKENEQALEWVAGVLNDAGLKFDAGFYPRTQKVILTVASNQDAQRARELIPNNLNSLIQVRVGPLVTNEQSTAPVGAQPGDFAQGGMTIHHSFPDREEGQPWCTVGFGVTYDNGKQGIVTAGHCGPPLHLYIVDHYIRLGDPVVPLTQSFNGFYDYAIYSVGGASVRNLVEYKDYNAIPQFPDRGTFRVTNWISGSSARVGYATCKSGFTTGITCGEVLSTFVGSGTHYGYVEVGNSIQERLSMPGDSGGPWFYYINGSTDVYAMGIHSRGIPRGATCSKEACRAYYMPIDRIWAHNTSVRPKTN